MAVPTVHRRKGIGWALMRHLIRYAEKEGLRELVGDVLANNQRMLDMCRGLGFEITSAVVATALLFHLLPEAIENRVDCGSLKIKAPAQYRGCLSSRRAQGGK